MDFQLVGAKAPLASDFLRPDPPRARHPYERVRVQSEHVGCLAGVQKAAGVAREMGAKPFSELACRGVVEGAEQGVSERHSVRTSPIV